MSDDAPRRACFVPADVLEGVEGESRRLPEAAAHYLGRVLRLRAGERVRLRDARGRARDATLRFEDGETIARLEGALRALARPAGRVVWLAPALIKEPRLVWLMEKAVELGADRVCLLETRRAVVRWPAAKRDKKRAKFTRVMQKAARQSGAHRLPELDVPGPLTEVARRLAEDGAALIIASPDAQTPLSDALQSIEHDAAVALFTGPEGGFTPDERAELIELGARAVTLGARVLRAETAPIAMLAAIRLALDAPR